MVRFSGSYDGIVVSGGEPHNEVSPFTDTSKSKPLLRAEKKKYEDIRVVSTHKRKRNQWWKAPISHESFSAHVAAIHGMHGVQITTKSAVAEIIHW